MKKKAKLPEVEPVRLKPVFGIKPGLYLLIIYIIIFLILLFLIGFLPGIVRGGRYVHFTSPLPSSGLEIDGVYQGSADYQYFVPSGKHKLVVKKADQVVSESDLVVDHPVFFTWLVHRRQDCVLPLGTLRQESKDAIIRFDLEEIERYSLESGYDMVDVYPPLFANLAKDVEALGYDEEVFGLAANYITSKEMLDDAMTITSDDPLFAKTLSLAKTIIDGSSGGKSGLQSANIDLKGKRTTLSSGNFIQDGITYPEAEFVMGDRVDSRYPEVEEAGVSIHTKSFTIATTEVSQFQWALFMAENPQWAKQAKNTSVDEYYLAGLEPSVDYPSLKPVYGVSPRAAEAFCKWLSEKTGKDVFLPGEAEWTLSAMQARGKAYSRTTSGGDDGTDSPSGMMGSVWELTSSPYIPLSRVTDYQLVLDLAAKYGIKNPYIAKGGASDSQNVDRNTIGVLRAEECSETVGFRIAWRDRDAQN